MGESCSDRLRGPIEGHRIYVRQSSAAIQCQRRQSGNPCAMALTKKGRWVAIGACVFVGLAVIGALTDEEDPKTEVKGVTETVPEDATTTAPTTTTTRDPLRTAMATWASTYGLPDSEAISKASLAASAAMQSRDMVRIAIECRNFGETIRRLKSHPRPPISDLAAELAIMYEHDEQAADACVRGVLPLDPVVLQQAIEHLEAGLDAFNRAIEEIESYNANAGR